MFYFWKITAFINDKKKIFLFESIENIAIFSKAIISNIINVG